MFPVCTIDLTDEQSAELQPLYDAAADADLARGQWAIVGQPNDDGSVVFVVVRKIAAAGIRALVRADREDRGEIH